MRYLMLLLFGFSFYYSHAQVNLNAGLVVYYPFSGSANDASGNGINATNFGATLTADQYGTPNSAYYFDGLNDYMQVAENSLLNYLTQMSLVAKVRVDGFYSGICHGNCIIDKGSYGDYAPGTFSLRFASNYNNPDCNVFDTLHQNYCNSYNGEQPGSVIVSNAPYIQKKRWDCLVYTFDGTTHKMYVNSILRYQYTGSPATVSNNDGIFLGRKNTSQYPYWFKGAMDEVRIYNRALNVDEVNALCASDLPIDTSVTVLTLNSVPAIINTAHGTLAMGAIVLPVAANQNVAWSIISGTGNASISTAGIVTAIANGTVWTKATSVIAPAYADSMQITISNQDTTGETGLSEIERNVIFSIYPNPANDILYIQIKAQHPELVIKITDLTGREIMTQHIATNALNDSQSFNLNRMAAGTYILQLQGKDLNINKRFVKQ